MRYLKTFENKQTKKYWLVPTDNRFEKSLNDIGCNKYFIDMMLNNNNLKEKGCKYIFIGFDSGALDHWGWMPAYHLDLIIDDLYSEYYEKYNYEFQGTVNIDDLKYELTKDRYNL